MRQIEVEIGNTVLRKEKIEVPAGSFETFVLRNHEEPIYSTWNAEGVGMVRCEAERNGELIIYELVEYRVQ